MAPNRLGSLSASSFFTRSLPGGRCEGTQPAPRGRPQDEGHTPLNQRQGHLQPGIALLSAHDIFSSHLGLIRCPTPPGISVMIHAQTTCDIIGNPM